MNDRLSEIEARVQEAPPGPWGEREDYDYYEGGTYITSPCPDPKYADKDVCRMCGAGKDFIKAAREDIPWLIEEVKRLRKGLTALADPNNYDAGGDWWGSDRNMPDWSGAYAQNILDGGQP